MDIHTGPYPLRRPYASRVYLVGMPFLCFCFASLNFLSVVRSLEAIPSSAYVYFTFACFFGFVPFMIASLIWRRSARFTMFARVFCAVGCVASFLSISMQFSFVYFFQSVFKANLIYVLGYTAPLWEEALKLMVLLSLVHASKRTRKNCVSTKKQFMVMAAIAGMGFQGFANFRDFALSAPEFSRDTLVVCVRTTLRVLTPLQWVNTGLASSFIVQQVVESGNVSFRRFSLALVLPVTLRFIDTALDFWGTYLALAVTGLINILATSLFVYRFRQLQ